MALRSRNGSKPDRRSGRDPQTSRAGLVFLFALGLIAAAGCNPIRHAPTGEAATTRDAARAAKPASDEFLVMSFNIRFGTADDGPDRWAVRRPRALEAIRKRAPDILGVQEGLDFQLDEIGAAFPRLERFGVGRDDGKSAGEHAAIFYDAGRFERTDGATFWFSDTPNRPCSRSWGNEICRICTWVRLRERASDRSLAVYNVHLDHRSQPSRRRSVELLLDVIGRQEHSDHVIITGDFNADEDSPEIQFVKSTQVSLHRDDESAPLRFVDSYRVLHPEQGESGTFNSWVGNKRGPKIDYIFLPSGTFGVVAAAIAHDRFDGRFPSDHFPVWARLTWPDSRLDRKTVGVPARSAMMK